MANLNTGIEWCDATWNPISGCTKVSSGCKFCFAERMFPRVYGRDVVEKRYVQDVPRTWPTDSPLKTEVMESRPRKFTDVRLHEDRLDQPLRWKRPRKVFVNSMSDLFHPYVPYEFIDRVFNVMALAEQHIFQILTKRPERMAKYMRNKPGAWECSAPGMAFFAKEKHDPATGVTRRAFCAKKWPLPNVWLGTSAEDQQTFNERVSHLVRTPAAVRFVSLEPLLGPIQMRLATPCDRNCQEYQDAECPGTSGNCVMRHTLDWVIVGGESGPKARPMHPDWVRSLRDQCKGAGVPIFIKQLSGDKGKVIKDVSLFPDDLQIQEYPHANP